MGYWSEITKNRQFLAEWWLTQGPPWFFSMGFNFITRQKGPKIGNWTEQQTRGMNKKQMGTWPRIFWKAAAGFKNFHCFLMFTILCCFQRPNVAIEIHREFFSHVENDTAVMLGSVSHCHPSFTTWLLQTFWNHFHHPSKLPTLQESTMKQSQNVLQDHWTSKNSARKLAKKQSQRASFLHESNSFLGTP